MATITSPTTNLWLPRQPKQISNDGKILSAAVLALIIVAALVIVLHLYVRRVIHRRAHQPFTTNLTTSQNQPSRANPGLDPSLFVAIPTSAYTMERSDESTAECAVCLGGIAEGEVVRLLPSCNHVFHVGCIDMWLHSHATCPVCRAMVEIDETTELPPPLGTKDGGSSGSASGPSRLGESLRRMWSGRSRVAHGDGSVVVEDIERQQSSVESHFS